MAEENTLNPDVQRYMNMIQAELENERTRRMQYENQTTKTSGFHPEADQNLVQYQLDLKEELDRIFHLLSGHTIKINADGSEYWEEPDDDRLKIFSDYGVKQIMTIMSLYIHRDTLMSFYNEETITKKVHDFGIELSDLIYNRYEVFFYYPSPEDLFDKYKKYISTMKISEEELYEKCIAWSEEELQSRFSHYPMTILALIDIVHSTYLRALNGKERQSLRERINISQNANQYQDMNMMQSSSKQSGGKWYKPSTW